LGIRIHNLKDRNGNTCAIGTSPFESFTLKNGAQKLSDVVQLYSTPGSTSTAVYQSIQNNIQTLVEAAVKIRQEYKLCKILRPSFYSR
jgi:hypothetical protein